MYDDLNRTSDMIVQVMAESDCKSSNKRGNNPRSSLSVAFAHLPQLQFMLLLVFRPVDMVVFVRIVEYLMAGFAGG